MTSNGPHRITLIPAHKVRAAETLLIPNSTKTASLSNLMCKKDCLKEINQDSENLAGYELAADDEEHDGPILWKLRTRLS